MSDPIPDTAPRHRLPSFGERVDLLLRILFAAAVSIGCFWVLQPFLTAILLAAILATVTWPLFDRLRLSFGKSNTAPAALMVVFLAITVLIPTSVLLLVVAQQIPKAVDLLRNWIASGFSLPAWISDIPRVGPWLHDELTQALDPTTLATTIQKLIEPLSSGVLNIAVNVSNGLLQLALVAFIIFFFYRDGPWFADRVRVVMRRVSGELSSELTGILVNTTRSVVFSLLGTALGQALVAGIGFWIVGAPAKLMLCFLVFVLSIVPVGPPLVWGTVAVWLYSKGETGMAVFLVLWGSLAVSSVDNFLKPVLIARGCSLPIALIFLGVLGGVVAFGFLGIILGPILLAVGVAMLQAWLKNPGLTPKRPTDNNQVVNPEK